MTLDLITLGVVSSRLREIGATMERLLFHSGYSTILRESHDGSACVADRTGAVVVGSGIPIHLFPYFYIIRAVLRDHPISELREGDSYIVTDPYIGGTFHVPDLGVVTPVFAHGEVIAFCASIAHKPDIGGLVPGSSSADSREIFHDGLLLPPVRYWTKDGVVKDLDAILRRNSRLPELTAGDVRAQVGCTQVGARRLQALCKEYSAATVCESFDRIQSMSENRMRSRLKSLPDGESFSESTLDSDGVDLDAPVQLNVRVVKQGDHVTFDFSKMNPQVPGPVNIRPPAAESASLIALLNILDPTIPINDGCRRVIDFVNPEGTLSNPRFPATVNNYFPTMHILYSIALKALSKLNPARAVGAAGFGIGGHSIGYRDIRTGKTTVQYELFVSSLGGTPQADGTPYVLGISHITPYTPIEILETEFPVRVTRFEPMIDSGGCGRNRGGLGFRKEYQLLADATYNLRMTGFRAQAWGTAGGGPPKVGRCILNPGTSRERLTMPLATFQLKAGDVIRAEFSGGGGHGRPYDRDPLLVQSDVANGYVSLQSAQRDYGVLLDPETLTVDAEATKRLRAGASSLESEPA